jgi:hypothetical protein
VCFVRYGEIRVHGLPALNIHSHYNLFGYEFSRVFVRGTDFNSANFVECFLSGR